MKQTIPDIDRKGLRDFALATGATLALLFGLVLPWLFGLHYPRWPWVVGGVLAVWGLAHPGSLRPVYRVWMRGALLMSRFTTPVILGLVFFVVITPCALVMRVFGRDAMTRQFDPNASSYRTPSRSPVKNHMERPF